MSYVYYINGTTLYYINLTDGKSVEDAIEEMLSSENVNRTNSTMKSGLDAWFKRYMLDYSDYLEDTIFCNDRSIKALNGWNANGGSISSFLQFTGYSSTNLSCSNITDQFSVSNDKAKLVYKVGLMSNPEMDILGNSNVRKTGQYYWLASPGYFGGNAFGRNVGSNGSLLNRSVNYAYGVRPAVSLASGTEYSDGDGSMEKPYKINSEN